MENTRSLLTALIATTTAQIRFSAAEADMMQTDEIQGFGSDQQVGTEHP